MKAGGKDLRAQERRGQQCPAALPLSMALLPVVVGGRCLAGDEDGYKGSFLVLSIPRITIPKRLGHPSRSASLNAPPPLHRPLETAQWKPAALCGMAGQQP